MNSLVIFLTACIAALAHGRKVCTDISQCGPGECCQILSEFMDVNNWYLVPSRPSIFKHAMSFSCEPYKLMGSDCDPFHKMNGYCSCEPGTTCKTEMVILPTTLPATQTTLLPTLMPTFPAIPKRAIISLQPGVQWISTCQKV